MKEVIIAALLAFLLSLSGCTILEPYDRSMIGFWDQSVSIESDGIGMSGFTQLGPWYFGSHKLIWRRNIECAEGTKPPLAPVMK